MIDLQRSDAARLDENVRSLNVALRGTPHTQMGTNVVDQTSPTHDHMVPRSELDRKQSIQHMFVEIAGVTLNVPVRDSDTVGHLKASIAQQRAVPVSQLRVIHSGRELRDDWQPVSALSLHNETKLFALVAAPAEASPSKPVASPTPSAGMMASCSSYCRRHSFTDNDNDVTTHAVTQSAGASGASGGPNSTQYEAEIRRLQRELAQAQDEKQRLAHALEAMAASSGDSHATSATEEATGVLPAIIQRYLGRTRQQLHEHRVLLSLCRNNVQAFEIERSIGYGQNGLAARVRCVAPGFPWPQRVFTLKVCFNFDQDTLAARGSYINEYLELSRLPPHSNVVCMVCEFFDEVRDHVREFLPDFVRDQSLVIARDGTRRNRKTQYYVLESLPMSLAAYLIKYYPLPARAPESLLATVLVHIGLALQHLKRNLLAHRDVKLENILLEFEDDEHDNEAAARLVAADGHRDANHRPPPRVMRCVLSEFGASCRLNAELKSIAAVSDIGSLLTPNWGNGAHIAPELHAQVLSALQRRTAAHVVVDYTKQPAFELGVLAYEIVNGDGPVPGYPHRDRRTGVINYDENAIAELPNVPQRVAALLRRAVSSNPDHRPAVQEIIDAVIATMDHDGSLAACVH